MSQSLKDASERIPTFLHELTLWQKLRIAAIRARAGLEQYNDLQGALNRLGYEWLPSLVRSIPEAVFDLAQMIRHSRRFVGVVYLGIGIDHEEVETWVQQADLGLAFSDPGFLSGSVSPEVALEHGNTMLIRLLSCSAAPLWLLSQTPNEQEVVFAPGERFIIVNIERRRLEPHGRLWVVDAEEMSWPSSRLPHWPERNE